MKRLVLFCGLLIIILLLGCDKDLKEHPLPESLKKELARKADPTIHNNDVFGTISIDPGLKVGLNPSAGLFIFARPEGVDAGHLWLLNATVFSSFLLSLISGS